MTATIFALAAAILWGLDYVLAEIILSKKPSVLFYLFVKFQIIALCVLGYLIISNQLSLQIKGYLSDTSASRYLLCSALVAIFANVFIYLAIKHSNATLAGIIEISYPIFIIIFSYFLLAKYQLDWRTLIGGLLIFCGVLIATYKTA